MIKCFFNLFVSSALLISQSNALYGGIVSNSAIVATTRVELQKQDILQIVSRPDAQKQLVAMGVDPSLVSARVDAMTDSEVQQLNSKLGDLQAGQDVIGLLVFLFIVFLITDMFGATDIFPFVNCVTCK